MVWQIVHEHISADSLGYHKHKADHKTKRKYSEQDTTGSQMKETKDTNGEKEECFYFTISINWTFNVDSDEIRD